MNEEGTFPQIEREEKRVFREDEEYLCGEVKRATRWAKER